MRRYLIVGNQTLTSDQLAGKVQDILAAGPAKLHFVVPATPNHEHLTWTEGAAHEAAHEVAERNLEAAVALFSALGAEIDGEVGDADAMEALRDALRGQSFDEIIVSTLPLGLSRWEKQDLPHRVSREFGLPVSHVVGDSAPPTPPHADTRGGEAVVHLDVEGGDPDAPEVQRLVREVAARTFASMPDLERWSSEPAPVDFSGAPADLLRSPSLPAGSIPSWCRFRRTPSTFTLCLRSTLRSPH